MRTSRTSFADNHPTAAGLGAVVLSFLLPTCVTLDRAFVPARAAYDAVVIVRNSAGAEVAVSAAADALFAGEEFALAPEPPPDGGPGEEAASTLFKRAVTRRLTAGGDELFDARFGEGPWCFVNEPIVALRLDRVPMPWPSESGEPLELCTAPPPRPMCDSPDGAVLAVDPSPFDFGDIPLGMSPPPAIPITLSNSGVGDLCLASVVAGGRDALDFRVDDSDCRPASPEQARAFLGAGGRPSCTLLVTFDPTRPGPRQASLRISSSDPETLREFPLAGTALPGALTPITPFCVPRDGACFRGTLTLTNTGPGAVTVRSLQADAIGWTNACSPSAPAAVPAGGTVACTFESCDPSPGDLALIIGSDGVRDDPNATVVEVPIVAQVTPGTCTP